MNIIPVIDGSVPGWLQATINNVANLFDKAFSNNIDVRIEFGFQSFQALQVPTAAAKSIPNYGYQSYEDVRAALAQGSFASRYAVAGGMPASDPTPQGGAGDVFKVTFALEKALGLHDLSVNPRLNDGAITLSSDRSWNTDPSADPTQSIDTIGVLEHEITEVLGRVGILGKSDGHGNTLYGPMDLFRFDRRSGTVRRDFSAVPGSYFSLRGHVAIEHFNNLGGDFADWSYTGSYAVAQDAFGAGDPEAQAYFSRNDLMVMRSLGYTVSSSVVDGAPSHPARTETSRAFVPETASSPVRMGFHSDAYADRDGVEAACPAFVFQPHAGHQVSAIDGERAMPTLPWGDFAAVADILHHTPGPAASMAPNPVTSTGLASFGAAPAHRHQPYLLCADHLA